MNQTPINQKRIHPKYFHKSQLKLKVHEVLKIKQYWEVNQGLPDYTTINQAIELYAIQVLGMEYKGETTAHGRMDIKNNILNMLNTSRSFQIRPEIYDFYKAYITNTKSERF